MHAHIWLVSIRFNNTALIFFFSGLKPDETFQLGAFLVVVSLVLVGSVKASSDRRIV